MMVKTMVMVVMLVMLLVAVSFKVPLLLMTTSVFFFRILIHVI